MQTISYMGNGVTTEFYFNFPYFDNTNIVVTVNNQPAPAHTVIGTPGGVDSDIPYIGGKVVFETAPTSFDSIIISRSLPLARIVDYQPTEKIDPTTMNQDANYLMEVIKDCHSQIQELGTRYSEIANKESTETLLARIDAITEQISDFEDKMEQKQIMSKDDFYSYTTNCITKIPQNIELELNDGTLTLKAGSKVWYPDGLEEDGITKKFSYYITQSDRVIQTSGGSGTYMICISVDSNDSATTSLSSCLSGDNITPTQYSLCYDTATNIITRYKGNAEIQIPKASFPLAVVRQENSVHSSMDQVFNGFGYIGSTIFALPGIEGLIPNGRDSDGTLKSIIKTNTIVRTTNVSNLTNGYITLNNWSSIFAVFDKSRYSYDDITNYTKDTITHANVPCCLCGEIKISDNKITSFEAKNVFNLL